jgi:hypothetical protein
MSKIMQEQKSSRRRAQYTPPPSASLESIIPGQPIASGDGEFYISRRKLNELYSGADAIIQKYCRMFSSNPQVSDELMGLMDIPPAKVMFLDIETTGFSNNPLFLIGVLYFNGEWFVIDQLFARDYSEEGNLLHYFSEFALEFDALVTFNGKSFDAPFIRDRMIYHRKRFKWSQTHVDILHHSRRRWKEGLPDCKLQTLEREICFRRREGDVPGEIVPDVYREFVRSGDTRLLADVFHHNALDLITLLELTVMLIQ